MRKKDLPEYDDGRTVVDMNIDGIKGYIPPEQREKANEIKKMNLTKKERRAIFWAGVLSLVPAVLFIITSFGIAFALMYIWLSP